NITNELINILQFSSSNFHPPFRYINDATAFAMGETWCGAGSRFKRAVALTLGTGFGSAFLENGSPVTSGDDVPIDGCMWHLPFGDGIADDSLSVRWFIGEYEKQVGGIVNSVEEMAKAAANNAEILNIFRQYGRNMGMVIRDHVRKFKADGIVLGGSISKAYPLFGSELEMQLAEIGCTIPIVLSSLGENAAILGSAGLFREKRKNQ
ncbi:MAG: ROK family protein, partial [Bacteroidota bacterium]